MKRRYRTGDQIYVRERNLAIILNYLWEAGEPVSRAQLVEVSGLNKSTVGSLLAQMQSGGLVKENGISAPRPGRPGALIDMDPDGGCLIGAEIGVDFVSAVVTDLKAQQIWKRRIETLPGADPASNSESQAQVLQLAEDLVQVAVEQATAGGKRLFGIGLGVPGMVDHATGTLLYAPNLNWRNVPLREMWYKRFGVPVIVENEAKASALGERMLGVARQIDDFIFLSSGRGLGGGLVIDGKLYAGHAGFAGEVGHMTLDPNGPLCSCGNHGCWEVLIGPVAIIKKVRQAAVEGQAPILMGLCAGDIDTIHMGHVLQAAEQGEPAVLNTLAEVGRYLGMGIANLMNAFNPSQVILGGAYSFIGPFILPRANQEVRERALEVSRQDVRITLSAFGFDACVMGGAALILQTILNNPVYWLPEPAQLQPAEDDFRHSGLL